MSDGRTALLGLDWGTTSLRAYRIDSHGTVLEERASESGILRVDSGDFAGTLATAIGDWLADAPTAPIIAAGMIGSRQGWVEVPYATCPAGLPELALGLGRVPGPDGRAVHIVPGALRAASGGEFPDVMRGEETQIIGDFAGRRRDTRRYVLPGTHSKWAWCEDGRLVGFATYMTGEVYDVLRQHSILGRLMSGDAPDDGAFGRGLDRARQSTGAPPGRLLHDLFSTRTFGLVGTLPGSALASYLSGLLIGGEILAATPNFLEGEIVVLGSGALTALYLRALATMGIPAAAGASDAAAHGLWAIAQAAGLVGKTIDA